jgi:hypothetical protein
MDQPTIPPPTDTGEPAGYAATAAELRRLADALDALTPPTRPGYVRLSIVPRDSDTAAVDAVAMALLGKRGETERIGTDWYHVAKGDVRHVHVSIQAKVPGPPDERDPEIDLPLVGPREVDNGDVPTVLAPGVFGAAEGAPAGRAVAPPTAPDSGCQ